MNDFLKRKTKDIAAVLAVATAYVGGTFVGEHRARPDYAHLDIQNPNDNGKVMDLRIRQRNGNWVTFYGRKALTDKEGKWLEYAFTINGQEGIRYRRIGQVYDPIEDNDKQTIDDEVK